ncbi:hypothetical protein CDD81_6055 [Ophiocordyceps australis]|uniref:Uncharacterized protein n=1 Tax=Ophiocordyceps australis TaxID=1399860 RepID=A0A2C5XI07_9HYPO|nr:hypothetical protein CDD81_6055 [Ophiocordyceps australis]
MAMKRRGEAAAYVRLMARLAPRDADQDSDAHLHCAALASTLFGCNAQGLWTACAKAVLVVAVKGHESDWVLFTGQMHSEDLG